ncbi:MAG: acetyl-CoA carboxylase biotin carboxyl carrier protein [Rhizobiaceae bacterium]|nr:acetyl-CoA carboxylase biotin carboxyl carrier protein [Rhizobiaceae bacterium]MCV0408618.1 acetyl-CoA carboxylase biotin carboxyl carrier protein [Rhizobiaceae bacterium]
MSPRKPGIDQQLIRDLAAILDDTNLTEIEVEQDELRIRVSRQPSAVHAVAAPAPVHALPQAAPVTDAEASKQGSEPSSPAAGGKPVPSPMVGTAYAAPSPGAAPFIQVGQSVREGQTLLIIEAMKTMNQIPAPRAGKVTAILFEDGQPVEFGEPLVMIE